MTTRCWFRGLSGLLLAVCWAVSVHAASRRETVEQFEVQMRTLNHEQALRTAEELLKAAHTAQPPRTQDIVEAHSFMGRAYLGLENLAAAENHFAAALSLAEQQLGPSNARLIDPLTNLGVLYARSQRHDEAVAYLERALILSRRNAGLYDPQQSDILRQLVESYTTLGAVLDAQRQIEYLRTIAEREYGADDVRTVPTLCEVADWYSRVGDGNSARILYRRAIAIVESKRSKESLELVRPLQGLARSYVRDLFVPRSSDGRRESASPTFGPSSPMFPEEDLDPRTPGPQTLGSEGEAALRRAVEILEKTPQSTANLRSGLLSLGDWFQIKRDERKSMPLYARAATLMEPNETALLESSDSLQTPVLLYYPTPPGAIRYISRSPSELESHFVLVEFSVTAKGEVKDIKVVESDASDRHVKQTVASMERARYRPRFVNGEPVATAGIRHRQIFKTLKKSE
jgi:tetratricopeptide (TPR) repeat protein